MTLLINDADLTGVLSHDDVITAVEDGFRQLGSGVGETLPRREIRIREKDLAHADPRMTVVGQGLAYLGQSGVVVLNQVLQFPSRVPPLRFVQYLVDANDGNTLAVVDSLRLGSMRTGAGGAIGAKYLSRSDSDSVGIIGSGSQARIQLDFLMGIRPIKKALVFSRNKSKSEKFCREMEQKLGISCVSKDTVEQVVEQANVLVTTTPSFAPFVFAKMLPSGIHVNIIGADEDRKIELAGDALQRADKVVIAGEECYQVGQIRIPLEQGLITRSKIFATIGEIIAGKKKGRENADEITVFHSPGISIQDAAVSFLAYTKARDFGLGTNIPDPFGS